MEHQNKKEKKILDGTIVVNRKKKKDETIGDN